MGATADLVKRWAELYNDGSPDHYGSDEFLQLYAEDVAWVEAPTALTPAGRAGDLRALRQATTFGRQLFRNRQFVIDELVEERDRAIFLGTLSITIGVDGLPFSAGTTVQIPMAILIEVRDGLIVRQRDFPSAPVSGK